jgi:DNA-binding XRE family transcriptional regulator
MGYRLRMSEEIRDWLIAMCSSDPPAAALVGEALTALAQEGERLGPPLVIPLTDWSRSVAPPKALDQSYQTRLESMQVVRHHVAEAATLRKDLQRQIAELQSMQAMLDEQGQSAPDAHRAEAVAAEAAATNDLVAKLQRLISTVIKAEQRLNTISLTQQTQTDAFRARKEALKAAYVTARAETLVEQALTVSGQETGDNGMPDGSLDLPPAGTAARSPEVTGEIERELRRQTSADDLMELRPGAPGDSEIRILFAVEPPGTALLIAALEGRDAVRYHYREAIFLATGVLRRARAGQAPEAAGVAFDDTRSFLGEFFADSADEIEAGAATLVARNRARTLAEQRTRLGLTQAQVAQRMGVRQERVSAIERAEPDITEIRTLAGYVEALGGRLEIVADFGEERILLR